MSGVLTVFFYARLWRRAGVITDAEFIELRYGGKPATVGISTVVWVTVMFLTAPEDDAVLGAFYLWVRPGGRGWRPVAETLGLAGEPIGGGPLNWPNWIAGVVSVYSSLFGVGQIIFGATLTGIGLLLLAAVCFWWIGRNLRPSRSLMGPVPGVVS